MSWFDGSPCIAAATLGWLFGGLAGVTIDTGILIAIILSPRLRDHSGVHPGPRTYNGHWMPTMPAVVAIALWTWGLVMTPADARPCYALPSALAAAIVVALPILVLFPLAATQIARRSVW